MGMSESLMAMHFREMDSNNWKQEENRRSVERIRKIRTEQRELTHKSPIDWKRVNELEKKARSIKIIK